MKIRLTKEFTTGQGIKLSAGDSIDCCREIYTKLLNSGGCEPLAGDKPKKKKEPKIKE